MNSSKKNFIYHSMYQILAIIIPLITTPYLTRVLGAEGLGEYSYAYSIAYYFVMIMQLGLNNYGNREIAKNRDDVEKLATVFWSIMWMQWFFSFVSVFLYFAYTLFISTNVYMTIVMVPYVLSGAFDITWCFFGLEEFKITVLRNTIIKIVSTVCIFIFVNSLDDVYIYSIIITTSTLISQLVMWPVILKKIKYKRVNFVEISRHIKPNLILFIPILAVSIYKMMDKIMLGGMCNNTEVGYYDSSEKIIQIPMALIASLGTVMLPRMSNIYSKGEKEKAEKVFCDSITLAMFLSTSMGFGIMAIADIFIPWFFGEGFESCITLFYVLLPSCMFLAFANVIRTQYLVPKSEDIKFIVSLVSGAVTNVFLNVLLIPKMQATGAAIGTLVAEVVVCILQAYMVRKNLPIFYCIKKSIPFIFAGIIMFIVINSIPLLGDGYLLNIIVKILLGVIVYLTCISKIVFQKVIKRR